VLNRPELIAEYLAPYAKGLEVEKFWVLCLNRKNRLKKLVEVTSGTATGSLVHPREAFRAAIQHGATAVVCAHNHPSGDPAPSSADIQVTRRLREAAVAIDIELIDHVVVGEKTADPANRGFYSFREAGLLLGSCLPNWRSPRPRLWPPARSFRGQLRRMPVVSRF
jgi:DNA repair protein RadC